MQGEDILVDEEEVVVLVAEASSLHRLLPEAKVMRTTVLSQDVMELPLKTSSVGTVIVGAIIATIVLRKKGTQEVVAATAVGDKVLVSYRFE